MIEKSRYEQLCSDFIPAIIKMSRGKNYAISLGGSHGKGVSDSSSDFDFRMYYDESIPWSEIMPIYTSEIQPLVEKWDAKGVKVDGVWVRSIQYINNEIDNWSKGIINTIPMEWSVWGYTIITDVYNQMIIKDPYNIIQGWKDRLSVYPPDMKKAIIDKYSSELAYWKVDYHYKNKVRRGDVVFLSSLSARLIHCAMQVIYAVNEFYYPGDGMNLLYAKDFKINVPNLTQRVTDILYPTQGEDIFVNQYENMISIIDDILELIKK